jgi:hypothetical protein
VFTTIALGQPAMAGASASTTVTVNEHVAVFPEVSVAVQVTVVVPFGNADPDAGEQTTEARPQLSLPVGMVHVTTALQSPGSVFATMFAGQPERVGGIASVTVTLNEHVATLPEVSAAVYVTTVVPIGNEEPDA